MKRGSILFAYRGSKVLTINNLPVYIGHYLPVISWDYGQKMTFKSITKEISPFCCDFN